MASTNKTPNIGLNDWLPNDKLEWGDVNADNAIIDTAMGNCWNRDNLKVESGVADVKFSNSEIGYSFRNSNYSIVGSLCILNFYISCNGTMPSTPVKLTLSGLPVPVKAENNTIQSCYMSYIGGNALSPQMGGVRITEGAARLVSGLTTSRWVYDVTSAYVQDGTSFSGTIIYKI